MKTIRPITLIFALLFLPLLAACSGKNAEPPASKPATGTPTIPLTPTSTPQWDYWLDFNSNGGTGGFQIHFSNGWDFPWAIPGPKGIEGYAGVEVTREGYTFKYWNTKADGTGVIINPGHLIENSNIGDYIDHASVLYAIWEKNP